MGDPYWRYVSSTADTGSIQKPNFPGYLSSEASLLATHHPWSSGDLRGTSDYPHRDILPSRPGAYGVDGITGIGVRAEPGASTKGYPYPLEDTSLIGQRQDIAVGISSHIPDIINEMPGSLTNADGLSDAAGESNILFVDGLPNECSRREAGHLFRPFIGFRDIKVIHKEARRSGDKAMVLCFVEFTEAKCALTALEALQGYKFDDKKPDSPVLKIHFAHFPFRPPSERDLGGPR